ncbi:MAG: hypothetical protein NC192_12720 [Muribaculaceae bacterium]|nr:hypothetical protein [Muribaculaceae bacterium]
MKDFILNLLAVILAAAISFATPYLVACLRKKGAQIAAQVRNSNAKLYLNEATEAIATAVTAVSQTFVDSLKQSNAFTKEAQTEALEKAKSMAISIMSEETKNYICDVYGDLSTFLTAKIEENVRIQKNCAIQIASVANFETENG